MLNFNVFLILYSVFLRGGKKVTSQDVAFLPRTILFYILGGDILVQFPSGNEEISLLKFIGKYQYLNTNDIKYFFSSNSYYRTRIRNLIKNKYIRRLDSNLIMAKTGAQYLKSINTTYNRTNRNQLYIPRLLFISHLAAFYYNCPTVTFIPSFDIKDTSIYTITSRRYIGILNINGTPYLTYHITKNHDKKYIGSVIYDIQKEKQFKNYIILVEDLSMINLTDFTFGYNQVIIIEDNEINREKLKYLNSVNWPLIIEKEYKNPFISYYNFCDYMDMKDRFINYFYFIDTEKINRVLQFLRESKEKHVDIICSKELKEFLKRIVPRAKYNVIDLEKYIDRKRNIYYEYK